MTDPFAAGVLVIVTVLGAALVAPRCLAGGQATLDPFAAGVVAVVAGVIAAFVALLCLAACWAGRDDEEVRDRGSEQYGTAVPHDAGKGG